MGHRKPVRSFQVNLEGVHTRRNWTAQSQRCGSPPLDGGFTPTNGAEGVVHFYHGRGTAEQWIKEGKYALHWTRLSCKRFVSNQVRLGLFVLAYNLGNFLRRLVLPRKIKHWSLRSLLVKLIKIGAKVVRHNRYTTFQMAAVAIDQTLFAEILSRIKRLRNYSV